MREDIVVCLVAALLFAPAAAPQETHAGHPTAGGLRVHDPGQRWTTHFDGRGFLTRPDAGDWTWGLELVSYGFAGRERTTTGLAGVRVEGSRVDYDWDDSLTEWYVNDERGLEHGYTLRERPPRSGPEACAPLTFTLNVRGDLEPRVDRDGRGVVFTNRAGASVLTYGGLTVVDASGLTLPARLAPGHEGLVLTIDDRGASYPVTIDPIAQQAYLKASNTGAFDEFGHAVAVSGDTVVVGARLEDSSATGVNGDEGDGSDASGAVYVFVRNGDAWIQQAYLKASNTGAIDEFGWSVAISGDTIVVGARAEDSAATGVDGNQGDNTSSSAGAAYVFVRDGTEWSQQAYLKASNTGLGDAFGFSVGVSGDTVVVGAHREDSAATGVGGDQASDAAENSGAAYVFVRNGTTWRQQAYLKASNTGAGDNFGYSVAISGDTIVVGANFEASGATGVDGDGSDDSAPGAGAAYVFARDGTSWSQQAYLKASNTDGGVPPFDSGDLFGWAVSASGDTVVVGAPGESSAATGVNGDPDDDGAADAGAAFVFERSGTTWSQQAYLKASNTDANDGFGYAVGISGDTIVTGAYIEASAATGVDGDQDDDSALASGAAYVFERSGSGWSQHAYLKASNASAQGHFGFSVAASDDTVVVGANRESYSSTGVNGDQTACCTSTSGAAYVFLATDSECFLVVGDGPGAASFVGADHVFVTQVDAIEDAYAVLLEDTPEFVLPWPATARGAQGTSLGAVPQTLARGIDPPTVDAPAWMLDGDFAVQVLMWNPAVFPDQPEQFTAGLYVSLQPDGTLRAAPYGDDVGGLAIWYELDVDAEGQPVIRFPFSIPGF